MTNKMLDDLVCFLKRRNKILIIISAVLALLLCAAIITLSVFIGKNGQIIPADKDSLPKETELTEMSQC